MAQSNAKNSPTSKTRKKTDATHEMPEINESTDESDSDEWYDKQCQKHRPPAKVNVGDFVIC